VSEKEREIERGRERGGTALRSSIADVMNLHNTKTSNNGYALNMHVEHNSNTYSIFVSAGVT
jgi:hypothetical protein